MLLVLNSDNITAPAKTVLKFLYKAIVPALSIDKASSWPFNEAGDMCSPPVMIFATPTYRGGGHLLPSYNGYGSLDDLIIGNSKCEFVIFRQLAYEVDGEAGYAPPVHLVS